VVGTVYPIKAKHLSLFREMLGRGEKNLKATGNNRVTVMLNGHNPVYITDTILPVAETTLLTDTQP
jgi:hypothetical protein